MSGFIKNRIVAFLSGRCPKCQTGSIFQSSFLSTKFQKVNDRCPHCGTNFSPEPGFFWGAMYFSYALVVGWCIVTASIFYQIYEEPPLVLTSVVIIGTTLLLLPLIARLSRLLLIYLIAPYRQFEEDKV